MNVGLYLKVLLLRCLSLQVLPLLLVHKFLEPRRLRALPGLPRRRLHGAALALLLW